MLADVSFSELLKYSNGEREKWRAFFTAHPAALTVSVQPGGRFPTTSTLIDHIFLVEKRHLQRMAYLTPLAESSGVRADDADGLFHYGAGVRAEFSKFLTDADAERLGTVLSISIRERSFNMTARKLALHVLVHEIRHWAQIALAVRNAGLTPPGDHDLFYSNALA